MPRHNRYKMKNGLLYIIFKFILDNLRHLTIVEWFKIIAKKINPKKNNQDSTLAYSRTAVDIFIILKWSFVLLISKYSLTSSFLTFFVWYLLLTNIYSYFYYHIWTDEALNTDDFAKDRIRRRFINLLLAVGYSDLCFAYLYKIPYSSNFEWSDNSTTFLKSIWYSISNSLAANYEDVKPLTDFANTISMTQLVITFIFITIILGNSIPQTTTTN
jgi:hypothetical protein